MVFGLAKANGAVINGVEGVLVDVEVDVSPGLPSIGIVGLPDASVAEARQRVRCAIDSSGLTWPMHRVTISLTPAEVRKAGSGLDLPIAMGVLAATGQVPAERVAGTVFVGELGLDGRLRPSAGTLAMAVAAQRRGVQRIIAAPGAIRALIAVPGVKLLPARTLREALLQACDAPLDDVGSHEQFDTADGWCDSVLTEPDLGDVRGQPDGAFALEVAAAGGHHVSLLGPPGVGKSMLAARLPGLLPDLADDEALEVAAIHGVAGIDRRSSRPPVSAPHHSASAAALLGAVRGSRVAPGAVTLAHRGCLLLDEAPEFARPCLEGLRQPLENGTVSLQRSGWAGRLPAYFQLVVTANPCPCGFRTGTGGRCTCTSVEVRRYGARLSGPLMDRIDVRIAIGKPTAAALRSGAEPTPVVRERVQQARDRAAWRFADCDWNLNSAIPPGVLRTQWLPDASGVALLTEWEARAVGLRGADRIIRLSWTLADLGGRQRPNADDVSAAMALRGPEGERVAA